MTRAALLLLLTACGSPVPVSGPREGIEHAAEHGLPVVWTPDADDALWHVREGDAGGHAGIVHAGADQLGCRRQAVIAPHHMGNPGVVAHEIGHMFGLGHHPDVANLMHAEHIFRPRFELTGEQVLDAWETADWLAGCRP